MSEVKWRVGRKVGRTIYEQAGDEPSDEDRLIGVMDTPQLALRVVEAVNMVRAIHRMLEQNAAYEQALAEDEEAERTVPPQEFDVRTLLQVLRASHPGRGR